MKPLDVLSALVLEDGTPWGAAADRVQWQDAEAFLADDAPPYAFWTRSRGYSKTCDAAAIALALMVTAPTGWRGFWLAADADQAALGVDAMAGFVARTPLLHGQVEVQAKRVSVPASSARLDVLAADAASAWGLRPDLVIADERANWSDTPNATRLWEAVSSAVTKRRGCRLLVVTTASQPSHSAYKDLEHARASDMWAVSETPGPPPWTPADRLAEQRQRLPESIYRQLFQNEWVEVEGAFLDPALVDACFVLDGPSTERYRGRAHAAGLDLGSTHDASVFAVGHREGEAVALDRMLTWQGSKAAPVSFDAVQRSVLGAQRVYKPKVLADMWQAMHVTEQLRREGVHVESYHFTPQSKARLASTLFQLVSDGQLRLYEAEGLRDELKGLRLVPTKAGGWAFDHTRRGHDDRAVSLALMCVQALQMGRGGAPHSINLREVASGNRWAITKGGISLSEEHHWDRVRGGGRTPPPGWSESNERGR